MVTEGRSQVTIRGVFHALLTVLTWILFAYWWKEVIPQVSLEDASLAFLVIFLTFLITSVLTIFWVRYNIGIYHRKGPRRHLPAVSEESDTDYLHRKLEHTGNDFLKTTPLVVVSLEGDKKIFEIPQRV